MAKITYLELPPGIDLSFAKGLNSGDRFVTSRLRRTVTFMTRKRKAGLTAKTLLPQVSTAWANLTPQQQNAWKNAGLYMNLSGWRMYVKDKTYRLKNEIAGEQTPSTIYQNLVGRFHVEAPASALKVTQLHPSEYWVSRLVKGTKGQREPVLVQEDFDLPLDLAVSYRSSLTASGPNPYARFYAIVYSLYQGRNLQTTLSIDFSLLHDWERKTASLESVIGAVKAYALFIELNDVRGDLFVDNLQAIHSAQNWLRDRYCTDINQSFTRAFYQVPKNWVAVDLPEGSSFESVYYEN